MTSSPTRALPPSGCARHWPPRVLSSICACLRGPCADALVHALRLRPAQLIRCWQCVKEANSAPAYMPGYSSKVDMCLNFCYMLPTPRFTGMTDPGQCECVYGGALTH